MYLKRLQKISVRLGLKCFDWDNVEGIDGNDIDSVLGSIEKLIKDLSTMEDYHEELKDANKLKQEFEKACKNIVENNKNLKTLLTNPAVAATVLYASDNWTENITLEDDKSVSWFANGINEYTELHKFTKKDSIERYGVNVTHHLNGVNLEHHLNTCKRADKLPLTVSKEEAKAFNNYSWFMNVVSYDITGVYMYMLNNESNTYKLCIALATTSTHGSCWGYLDAHIYQVQEDTVNNKYIIDKDNFIADVREKDFYNYFQTELDPTRARPEIKMVSREYYIGETKYTSSHNDGSKYIISGIDTVFENRKAAEEVADKKNFAHLQQLKDKIEFLK